MDGSLNELVAQDGAVRLSTTYGQITQGKSEDMHFVNSIYLTFEQTNAFIFILSNIKYIKANTQ